MYSSLSRFLLYMLLLAVLLAVLSLIQSLADATIELERLRFLVVPWACYSTVYACLLIEPTLRSQLLLSDQCGGSDRVRVLLISATLLVAAGIRHPSFLIYKSSRVDVYVCGIGKRATIIMSRGVALLDKDDLRCVLAHEFAHIRLLHPYVRLMMFGSLLSFAMLIQIAPMAMLLVNLIVLWIMRQMEFSADDEAARIVGRHQLCSTLCRMQKLFSDSPEWQHIVCSHPSFQRRIARSRKLKNRLEKS